MRSAWRLWAVGVTVGLLLGLGALTLAVTSDFADISGLELTLELLVGWSFLAAGLVARTRRPENNTGLLLMGVSVAWFANGLGFANNPWIWSIGNALGAVWAAVFVHTLLAYPSGRLESKRVTAVVAGGYVLAGTANIIESLFDAHPAVGCPDCPTNKFLISDNHTAATAIASTVEILGAIYLIAVAAVVWWRWRGATAAARRLLGPVLIAGGLGILFLGVSIAVQTVSQGVSNLVFALSALGFLAVPFLIMSGVLRTRRARAGIGRAMIGLREGASLADAQAGLRDALGDPDAELLFWNRAGGQFVGVDGSPRELQQLGTGRIATTIEADGEPLGALVYDAALANEPDILADARDAGRMALAADRARFALETTERRNRALLEAIPDAMIRIRRDGTVVDWHADERHITFDAPDGFLGMNLFELVREEHGRLMQEAAGRALDTGELQAIEYDLEIRGESHSREGRIVTSGEDEVTVIIRDITERKRALDALETSERRSRALLEGVPDNIYRVARDGHRFLDIRWADPTRLPVPQERFIGGTVRDLGLPGDLAERFIALAEQAFATGRLQSIEYEVDVAGEPLYLEARIVPSGDDEYFVTVRDVTDRLRAQHALETSERRSRALLAGIPDNIFRVSYEDYRILDTRMTRVTRFLSPEGLVGRAVDEIGLPAPVIEQFRVAAELARETGDVQVIEYKLEDELGAMHLESRVVPSGEEFFVVVRDVTDRKLAELALVTQRDFLSAVGDATPALLAVVGSDGTMSSEPINHALRELTGISAEEASGANFFQLISTPDDAARTERLVRIVADTGDPQSAETRWRGRNGERLVAWTCTQLPDIEPGQRYVLISGVDVTERAAQEDELRRSRARIVEAGDAERRRLERNLHDGAQQRLVSLSLSLRLAQARLKSDPEAADALLAGASTELALALEELRELARGIHPAVLTDRGLGPALESLADRAPLPVELGDVPEERLPAPVEAAAFYVVSEALANVAKYADASSVRVSIARRNGRAIVEVADDGRGGADPARGSGLRGLVDRVSALDGTLSVDSPEGGGTKVRAEIPTAQE